MSRALPNPFSDAYVINTVSEERFVRYFSPLLVDSSSLIFQKGNVVVRGTQGSGKSMLLCLLDPRIRNAFMRVQKSTQNADFEYPLANDQRNFISTRIDLNKSGLLDIINTLTSAANEEEIKNITRLFVDFFNYWMFRGILECLEYLRSENYNNTVNTEAFDLFSQTIGKDDCWFGALNDVKNWNDLNNAVNKRVIEYRSWSNGNRDLLSNYTLESITSNGSPLSQIAKCLRRAEVIKGNTEIYLIVDQMEALWMKGGIKEIVGNSFRQEIHEMLGRRDSEVSFKIGARRYDWGKGGDLSMRDGRQLEEGRDYQIVDIDLLLRRTEKARSWIFPKFAADVFRRRVAEIKLESSGALHKTQGIRQFFGTSPTPQEQVAKIIKNPDICGTKLLRIQEDDWPENWRKTIYKIYNKEFPNVPTTPPKGYSKDPLNAVLLISWGLQTGGKIGAPKHKDSSQPPTSGSEAPFNKQYWLKERYPQAVLQLISRHQQQVSWWGYDDVLALSGSNILCFITICREVWDYWQRHPDASKANFKPSKGSPIVPVDVQIDAIKSASERIYRAQKRQPGAPAGDIRIKFLDKVASWLRSGLLDDAAMSYPGANGFSLRESALQSHSELRNLIEEAVGWGDLYEVPHKSKNKRENIGDPRSKYYINPVLSPVYQLPKTHTKEPSYRALDKILAFAKEAGAIMENLPVKNTRAKPKPECANQPMLPFDNEF